MKPKSFKAQRRDKRRQKHADARKAKTKQARRQAKKSSPFASWLGDRRPVIAPKSHEQMLVRLEERGVIAPRAVRMDAYRAKHRVRQSSEQEKAA